VVGGRVVSKGWGFVRAAFRYVVRGIHLAIQVAVVVLTLWSVEEEDCDDCKKEV
jgi:hypothetical protein